MKERGILYSAPMVRALLAGRKTQTRRAVKPQPNQRSEPAQRMDGRWQWLYLREAGPTFSCPYGVVGDRLWARETWMPDPPRDGTWPSTVYDGCKPHDISLIPDHFRAPVFCLYRATWEHAPLVGWVPAIHMFRWASRMTHELTEVRLQRLQEITEVDAIDEGVLTLGAEWLAAAFPDYHAAHAAWEAKGEQTRPPFGPSPVQRYAKLWEQINGAGSWDANPYVWALTFKEVA